MYSLCFPEIIYIFLAEGINDSILPKLNRHHIKDLFDKVGDRANFESELENWKKDPKVR